MTGVYGALVKAQAEFPSITRDRSVKVTAKSGASYTFAYAPLDSIMAKVGPVLAANSLAVTQTFGVAETGGPLLETSLIHADGSSISGSLPLSVQAGATAQEFGSLVTYCRRYAIVAILGLATEEDDDANHASGNASSGAAHRPTAAAPVPAGAGQPSSEAAPAVQPGHILVTFGKHKGTQVKDVPRSYWDWWLAQDGRKNEEVLAAVELHLGLSASPVSAPDDLDIPF